MFCALPGTSLTGPLAIGLATCILPGKRPVSRQSLAFPPISVYSGLGNVRMCN